MPKKKSDLDRFADLTWTEIEEWAGNKILSRGKNYQKQGRVSDLAVTDDDGLIAWVDGSERYATRVDMDDDGILDSICTCPYEWDCKHGVAVLIDYLKQVAEDRHIPKAEPDDERLKLLADEEEDEDWDKDERIASGNVQSNINELLKGKTKAQLIDLIHELAVKYPEMGRDLSERNQLISGDVQVMVAHLRKEIGEIGYDSRWHEPWEGESDTPDYASICERLEALLKAGYPDEVLPLGKELIMTGMDDVAHIHDHGETAMEVSECMPVIADALAQSSLDAVGKLNWALEIVLKDQYDLSRPFVDFIYGKHPESVWSTFADQLLGRLKTFDEVKKGDFSSRYERDRFSDWAIHALEEAGREKEIIPLCESEARLTGSYERLIKRLMTENRYEEAETWIQKGIAKIKKEWPGTASRLRERLQEIRRMQKNWPVVAAMAVDEFVRSPSQQTFSECRKATEKTNHWAKVREFLLRFLETGNPPWQQKGWPLPESGLDRPKPNRKDTFPMIFELIELAILEKKPDQVLKWYDRRPKGRFGWFGVDEDAIATAVQSHAPDRAVAMWKKKAEGLIAQVKPSAYREAAIYLRKAAAVMAEQQQQAQWDQYIRQLRKTHARKYRLMEILNGLEGKSVAKGKR